MRYKMKFKDKKILFLIAILVLIFLAIYIYLPHNLIVTKSLENEVVTEKLKTYQNKINEINFSGYKVNFSYQEYQKERELVFSTLSKHYNTLAFDKKLLGIDLYDLDNDGSPEILVNMNICSGKGCIVHILKTNNKPIIISSFDAYDDIFILDETCNMYHSIVLLNHVSNCDHPDWSGFSLYRWNNKDYELSISMQQFTQKGINCQ